MDDNAFEVGQKYCIRTDRWGYTGRLVRITPTELVLDNAARIPNMGPLYHALSTGQFVEVQPFPLAMLVSRRAIVDATIWPHDLPSVECRQSAPLEDEEPCAVLSGVLAPPVDDRRTQ